MSIDSRARAAVKACSCRDLPRPKTRETKVTPPVRKDCRRPSAAHLQWHCRPKGRSINEAAPNKTLSDAQDGICALCGLPVEDKGSIDHTDPIYRRGEDELGNWTFAHAACNSRKSNDDPTGCEVIWLLMVNAKLGAQPTMWVGMTMDVVEFRYMSRTDLEREDFTALAQNRERSAADAWRRAQNCNGDERIDALKLAQSSGMEARAYRARAAA